MRNERLHLLIVLLLAGVLFAACTTQVDCSKVGSRAALSGCNLKGADLSGAKLSGADLSGAKLSGTDLRKAILSEADLSEADLSGANLTEVIYTNDTIWPEGFDPEERGAVKE